MMGFERVYFHFLVPCSFQERGCFASFLDPSHRFGHPLFCHEATILWLHLRKGIGGSAGKQWEYLTGYRVKCATGLNGPEGPSSQPLCRTGRSQVVSKVRD